MSSSSRGAEIWQKARAQRARNMRERSERNVSSIYIYVGETFFEGYQKVDHHPSEAGAKQGSETGVRNRGSQSSRFEANMPDYIHM